MNRYDTFGQVESILILLKLCVSCLYDQWVIRTQAWCEYYFRTQNFIIMLIDMNYYLIFCCDHYFNAIKTVYVVLISYQKNQFYLLWCKRFWLLNVCFVLLSGSISKSDKSAIKFIMSCFALLISRLKKYVPDPWFLIFLSI